MALLLSIDVAERDDGSCLLSCTVEMPWGREGILGMKSDR